MNDIIEKENKNRWGQDKAQGIWKSEPQKNANGTQVNKNQNIS